MASIKEFGSKGGDHYAMLEQLGVGASGAVYKCQSTTTSELFAVKVINLRHIRLRPNAERELNRIMHEIRCLQELDHPHIVSLREVIEASGCVFLVMELVHGGDLFERIVSRGRMQEEEAKQVFSQLLLALEYIHARGIIHRDLKPENILLSTNESGDIHIKVTDFGLSKIVKPGMSAAKTFVGTPQYYAPEVLSGVQYNEKVDLWSAGALLYVMLAAKFPFQESSGQTIEQLIREGTYSFEAQVWEEISDEAKHLISALMKVNVEERYTIFQCKRHPWILGAELNQLSLDQPQMPPNLIFHPEFEDKEISTVQINSECANTGVESSLSQDGCSPTQIVRVQNMAVFLPPELEESKVELRELCLLQDSIAGRLQKTYYAFQDCPEVLMRIRTNAIMTRELQLQANQVVKKFDQTARSVLTNILPDLRLAVEINETSLVHDLFEQARGWIHQMKKDAQNTQRSYHQVMYDLAKAIEVANAYKRLQEGQPLLMHSESLSYAVQDTEEAHVEEKDGSVEKVTEKEGAMEDEKFQDMDAKWDVNKREVQSHVESVLCAVERMSSNSLEKAQSKHSSPGSPSALNDDLRIDVPKSEDLSQDHEFIDEAIRLVCLIPPNKPILWDDTLEEPHMEHEAERNEQLELALKELKRIDQILHKCTTFWGNMEIIIEIIHSKEDHAETLLKYIGKSERLQKRFFEHLQEYEHFWKSFQLICGRYCMDSRSSLLNQYAFLTE